MVILVGITGTGMAPGAKAQAVNIRNDQFWNTKDGQPVYSQGGGIFRFADPATGTKKYYWYGVHYKQADAYRADPSRTQQGSTFESVTCYSSTDLVNWSFERDVLTRNELMKHEDRPTWVGRLGVAYVKELNKYALVVQHGSQVLIVTSDTPAGEFTWHRQISMMDRIGTTNTGDQTVFTDEDTGKSYLVYSYGRGRNKIYVSEIGVKDGMVDLLDCVTVFQGEGREGNCLFKYKSKYYMCASDLYGWDASHAYYLVADDIRGPYTPKNQMLVMKGCEDDYAHTTQTGFFYTVKGTKQETVIFCGDRWADFAGNGLGYNQWCPLSFEDNTPYFNSLSSWNLDVRTGEWNAGNDNDYAKNGSFEADRKKIPSNIKPVQTQLLGWVSAVVQGNPIGLDSTSPALNHENSEADRKTVVGERSLNLSDKVDFKRKVFQTISSSPYVKLEDGDYTLTAKTRSSAGFSKLVMYAKANGKTLTYNMKEEGEWKIIRLEKVPVKGGQVEIGFLAEGTANAFCYVDDVSLRRVQRGK